MEKWECNSCNFIYDDEKQDVKFEKLSEEWVCQCGLSKDTFLQVETDPDKDGEELEDIPEDLGDIPEDLGDIPEDLGDIPEELEEKIIQGKIEWSTKHPHAIDRLEFTFIDNKGEWICGKCAKKVLNIETDNFKTIIRNLKGKNYDIEDTFENRVRCKDCGEQVPFYKFNGMKKGLFGLEDISGVREKILFFYDNIDDLFFKYTDNLQVDHRMPKKRLRFDKDWADGHNALVNSLNELKEKEIEKVRDAYISADYGEYRSIIVDIFKYFQLLRGVDNRRKGDDCDDCVDTQRRASPIGFDYWYEGSFQYDNTHKCIGCIWYNPTDWRIYTKDKIMEEYSRLDEDPVIVENYLEPLKRLKDTIRE